jgi:bifunctional pyridoxal-dependent enzyme with beta-cystathionase and maltose regulon repressor activities
VAGEEGEFVRISIATSRELITEGIARMRRLVEG